MNVEFAQIFTQIISFLIVLWVLKRFAWKPFLKILEERENKIKAEFVLIEKGKEENAQLKKEYEEQLRNVSEEAKGVIKEARDSGIEIAKKIEEHAHDEARRILKQAEEELKNEVRKAKLKLKDDLVKITLSAAEKMMETNMDQEKQTALVKEFVEKMESP